MKTRITFEELAQLPFFEGVVTLSFLRTGEYELFFGDIPLGREEVDKIVEEVVRALRGTPQAAEIYR